MMMEDVMETQSSPDAETPQAPAVSRPSRWRSLQRAVLWLGFACIATAGWVRLVTAVNNWYWLDFAKLNPGPLYLAITGGLWGVTALAALLWMVPRRPGSRIVGLSAAVFFALTYWIDRLFISTHPEGAGNTPFAIFLTIFLLAYVYLVLRPNLRSLAQK